MGGSSRGAQLRVQWRLEWRQQAWRPCAHRGRCCCRVRWYDIIYGTGNFQRCETPFVRWGSSHVVRLFAQALRIGLAIPCRTIAGGASHRLRFCSFSLHRIPSTKPFFGTTI